MHYIRKLQGEDGTIYHDVLLYEWATAESIIRTLQKFSSTAVLIDIDDGDDAQYRLRFMEKKGESLNL